MKRLYKLSALVMVAIFGLTTATLTSCNDDKDEFGTEQYVGGVHLNVFGPSPVARGGELRFLGSGMKQVTSIEIPGCGAITDIKVISDEEIRCVVPQTAESGYVTLNFSNGKITTKTLLTYTEPISISSVTPGTIKAGETLTIAGEYLNLIKEVIFPTDVVVGADEFLTHSRSEIKVIVPLEAKSGKIIISDGDPEMPNWIYSETEIDVVLPSVAAPLDLTDAKPGDEITVTGKDFDLIVDVQMPDGSSVAFDVNGDKLTFTLPEDVTDGAVVMVAPSGVKVAIANIGVVVPTIESFSPATGVRPGDIITITGVNMDQVKDVTFANVADAVKPTQISATEVKVRFPAMAQTGIITLNLKSGKTNTDIMLETAKPEVMGFNPNPVPAAGEYTMTGKNLDLITAITYNGSITVEVQPSAADKFTTTAPATAQSGTLKLTMANGETVETGTLNIDAPKCAFITELVSEELNGGELLIAKVNNGDRLVYVLVNGEEVQYIISGENLYVQLPQTAGKGTVVTLVSNNGEISYTYDVTPATHVEIVAYGDGPRDLGKWTGEADGGAFRIYKDVLTGIPAGAKLVFHISCYDFAQIQVNDCNWSSMDLIQPSLSETRAEFELTEARLKQILGTNDGWSNTAIVVQGEGCIVNKVTIEYEISLETVIWQGEFRNDAWSGMDALAWGQHDWGQWRVGQVMRLYSTPTVGAGEWWCISVRHGDGWGNIPTLPGQYDMPESPLEIVLTSEVLDDIKSNMGLVVTGQGYILTKITIE